MTQSWRGILRSPGVVRIMVAVGLAVAVTGCAETRLAVHTAKEIGAQTASPRTSMGDYKVGKPYQIQGRWYYPAEDMDYVEEGMASWYGPNFHGKLTANGETYDMDALTAAHRTLPMPSIVRVTNLENGRAVVLRVNDRGPYAKNRIIDVSRRAAKILGFHGKGTTRVRVEVLPEESRIAKAQAISGSGDMPSVRAAPRIAVSAQTLESPAAAAPPPPQKTPETSGFLLVKSASAAEGAARAGAAWIQAGAFSDMRNAEGLSARLSRLAAVTITPVVINGRELYRVRLGPLMASDVDSILAAVRAEGLPSAHVVAE